MNNGNVKRFLDAIHYEPKVFYTIGENDEKVAFFTEFEDKTSLFDLSFYEDQANNPTIRYLKEHSVNDIFAGKNPDMIPARVCIVEGGYGIIQIHFECSRELRVAGVDDFFLLNRDLKDARFGIAVKGKTEKYIIGYDKSEEQKPYIDIWYEDGTKAHMAFDLVYSAC